MSLTDQWATTAIFQVRADCLSCFYTFGQTKTIFIKNQTRDILSPKSLYTLMKNCNEARNALDDSLSEPMRWQDMENITRSGTEKKIKTSYLAFNLVSSWDRCMTSLHFNTLREKGEISWKLLIQWLQAFLKTWWRDSPGNYVPLVLFNRKYFNIIEMF